MDQARRLHPLQMLFRGVVEMQRLARARIEYFDLHAEVFLIPLGLACGVADIDHDMIDRAYPD
jgi:hypothetical protein